MALSRAPVARLALSLDHAAMGSHGRHALFSDRARARPPDHPAPRAHVSGGGRGELAVLQPRGPHIGGRPRPPACRVMMMLEARWTISSWLFMIHLPSASATTIVDVRKRRRVVNDAALRSEGLSRRRRRSGPDCAAPRSNRRYNLCCATVRRTLDIFGRSGDPPKFEVHAQDSDQAEVPSCARVASRAVHAAHCAPTRRGSSGS